MFKDELITQLLPSRIRNDTTSERKNKGKIRKQSIWKTKRTIVSKDKQEEMEEVLTEKEAEEIGLVKSDLPVIEEVEEEGIEQEL